MELQISRSVPLHTAYDVIVAGGGPAGCAAAAAAAREGAKTLLIESTYALGGMGTAGLVPAWCPFSDKEKIIYGGIAEKVFTAAKAAVPHQGAGDMDWVAINAEALKQIYDHLVSDAGAEVLFGSTLCGVEAREGEVSALLVANKAGISAYTAKVFVDCTGDGDLAVMAGASFEQQGNPDIMAATHCFILTNVDEYAYLYDPASGRHHGGIHPNNPESTVYQIAADPAFPAIADTHLCNNLIGPRTVGFNAGHIFELDATDPAALSAAVREGREIARQYREALAKYFPSAFASSFLVSTAPLMGVRESRRIVGDYQLTGQDYVARASFPDDICRNSYYMDVHPGKAGAILSARQQADLHKTQFRYQKGESHGIPYRCLTPKGLRNLLVAGRPISCDRQIQGSVRVMPACLCTGEAAGMAACHAMQDCSGDVHAVDVVRLRRRLLEEGAYLGEDVQM